MNTVYQSFSHSTLKQEEFYSFATPQSSLSPSENVFYSCESSRNSAIDHVFNFYQSDNVANPRERQSPTSAKYEKLVAETFKELKALPEGERKSANLSAFEYVSEFYQKQKAKDSAVELDMRGLLDNLIGRQTPKSGMFHTLQPHESASNDHEQIFEDVVMDKSFVNKIYGSLKTQAKHKQRTANETAFSLVSGFYKNSLQFKPIASGGQGDVAKWTTASNDLAQKVNTLSNSVYFNREIDLLNQSQSDHIVSALLSTGDSVFLEFAQNGSLRDFSKQKEFNHIQLIETLQGASQGICDLHDNDIIHRDIKPENFLVFKNASETKVADLGLAAKIEDLTPGKGFYGTVGYIAPEGFGSRYSTKSDIFSFGATIYELLTGLRAISKNARQCNNPEAAKYQTYVWMSDSKKDPDWIKKLLQEDMENNNIAKKVETLDPTGKVRELMLRCLSYDPETRPTASEITAFLENLTN